MKKQTQPQAKVDQLLDELMLDYSSPEQILGEQGLIKQLSKRLIERALQAELTHHLQTPPERENSQSQPVRNSRNGFSSKTVHTDQGRLKRRHCWRNISQHLRDKVVKLSFKGFKPKPIRASTTW